MTFEKKPAGSIIVLGLGNPILGDDGIGWRVAKLVQEKFQAEQGSALLSPLVDFECLAVGGLRLMESMVGYDQAIIIDAIQSGAAPTGNVSVLKLDDLPNRAAGHLTSAHDTTLHNALQVGRSAGAYLPQVVHIISVEAQYVYDFSEEFSPAVAAAAPIACQVTLELIHQLCSTVALPDGLPESI